MRVLYADIFTIRNSYLSGRVLMFQAFQGFTHRVLRVRGTLKQAIK
jgi:hypothetical protein